VLVSHTIVLQSLSTPAFSAHPAVHPRACVHRAIQLLHCCLSSASCAASSHVRSIVLRSLITVPFNRLRGRPFLFFLVAGNQSNACFVSRLSSIRYKCPSHHSRRTFKVRVFQVFQSTFRVLSQSAFSLFAFMCVYLYVSSCLYFTMCVFPFFSRVSDSLSCSVCCMYVCYVL